MSFVLLTLVWGKGWKGGDVCPSGISKASPTATRGSIRMIVPAEQGETANTLRPRRRPIRSGARGAIDLSRVLHDHISQTMNLLLMELRILKVDTLGREAFFSGLARMRTSIRA